MSWPSEAESDLSKSIREVYVGESPCQLYFHDHVNDLEGLSYMHVTSLFFIGKRLIHHESEHALAGVIGKLIR